MIYREKTGEHLFEKKFAMPDVKVGSVINISYEIRSPFLFRLRGWDFQHKIPVIHSEYDTKMTPFYEYRYIFQGTQTLVEFSNHEEDDFGYRFAGKPYKIMVYHFAMNDVPAFKDESYITSINDYIIRVNFQLSEIHRPNGTREKIISTWPKLSEELMEHQSFGKYIKNSIRKCQEITDTLKLESKTAVDKAKIIDRFVKTNFNWNKENSKYATSSIKDFLIKKTGNAADINLFLIGMLNAAGIEAQPIILSTRSNGKIQVDYPFMHLFNYVIAGAKIDNKTILLDGTEPLSSFGQIPTRCFNDQGLIIQKGNVEWVDIKGKIFSLTGYNFDLKLNSTNDSIYENCKLTTTGYDAIDYRNQYAGSYKGLKTFLLGVNALREDSLKALNLTTPEKPFEISYNSKKQIEKVEDKIIIEPFCNSTITENPLKQPARSYPVDMVYHKTTKYTSTIKIPNGYKLLERPENLFFEDDLVGISFITDVDKDTIRIVASSEFKNDVYESVDYSKLKDDFNKIVDKFNEKLVLVKI
jgi:hypothetical protein